MSDEYLVIDKKERVEIKVKGSRFIASGQEINNQQEAEGFIELICKEFYNATHNCFAYKVGFGAEKDIISRAADAGEPSGTAGPPILQVIEGEGLTNTVIVVTRFFGGTKLGTGGLIRAYSDASKELIRVAGSKKRILRDLIKIEYDYSLTSLLMPVINLYNARITESDYGAKVRISIQIRKSQKEKFLKDLLINTQERIRIIE